MVLVCIASGPSLTFDDCELVRTSGAETIAVNCSWKMAPFCHHIYAGDGKWWDKFEDSINIPAKKWTCDKAAAKRYGLNLHVSSREMGWNSGQKAILWGIEQGFKKIILLGYDCSIANGTHWHGDHAGLKNPTEKSCGKWHTEFLVAAEMAKKYAAEIVNCSRETALTCFARQPLEETLRMSDGN